jgi:phage shock protein A
MLNEELESQLGKVREALTNAVAVEIQIKQQIEKNQEQIRTWEKRVAAAKASAQTELAEEADHRLQACHKNANELQIQLLSQEDFVAGLKKDLATLENRRFSGGGSGGASALAAADATMSSIQRMENKIMTHEAEAELSEGEEGKERKFVADQAASSIEDELQALKASQKKST